MIKPEELRIFNYVHPCSVEPIILPDKTAISRVTKIGLFNCELANNIDLPIAQQECFAYTYNRVSPIPLTEDWLVNLGWVYNEEIKAFENVVSNDPRLCLAYMPVNGSYTMFNYVLKSIIVERIKHVHQLQNIYFDLTGEEL